MSHDRLRIRGTVIIVHIFLFSNCSNVFVTNTIPKVDKARRLRQEYSTCIGSIMSVGRRRIRGTVIIVHIVVFSNCSNVVVTNTIPQVDKARRLRREYSTCIGRIMSVGRRIIRGIIINVHIVVFSNCSNVVVTNTIPQVDKARRLRREYSTCIGRIMSVDRSIIRGIIIIVHIVLFSKLFKCCCHKYYTSSG